jgi:hypothetical protein
MKNLLRILLGLILGYIFVRAAYDFYLLPVGEGWSEKYRLYWNVILVGWAVFFVLLIVGVLIAILRPDLYLRFEQAAIRLRERMGFWRWPVALILLELPVYLMLYSTPGLALGKFYLRIFMGFVTCLLAAIFITRSESELVGRDRFIFSVLLFGGLYVVADYLSFVTNYPFALFWSEGNRFYDYSVFVGSYRYDFPGRLTIPYDAPGRYLLWGILFAIHNTPIWLHRLWDALLWTALPLAFGFIIAGWSRLSAFLKAGLALWIFLFLYQGPIYPPLILSAILVVLLVRKDHLVLSLVGVALAGYYASSSRWTWAPAPAIWAVLILVSGLELKAQESRRSVLRQLLPILLIGGVGLATGYFAKSSFFDVQEITTSTALEQPLLWYRLFPNATYPIGITIGLAFAAGPLLVWMVWAVLTRWWRVDWLQGLTYALAVLATLVVGLVISVKIGGGSNLHNLDMFFVTLVVLTGIMLKGKLEIPWKTWPVLVQLLVGLIFILPTADALKVGGPLQLPSPQKVNEALTAIRDEVAKAKQDGEVLFMDQRQLLTFGYVQDVPLVADYEKKYDMDMAMASNQEYFDQFYADLRRRRFSLIISDPLRTPKKSAEKSFGDENNAWVEWVSRPVLCYYKPIATFEDVRVQLLVPRSNPENCP